MPVTIPSTDGLPNLNFSSSIHATEPAAAEICVTSIAIAALPSAASALPPLKPNQPTQSMPAPVTVIVMLCGGIGVLPKPVRGPSTSAQTSDATPAVMCTTVPPAKSSRP